MSATAASAEPSRATLIKWLRLNLGLTSMIGAGLFTAAGVLIDGTVRVNNYDNRLDAVEAKVDVLAKRLDSIDLLTSQTVDRRVKLANDLATIDQHLAVNDQRLAQLENQTGPIAERRIKLASDLGLIDQRLSVLESQSTFLGSYLRDAHPPGPRK